MRHILQLSCQKATLGVIDAEVGDVDIVGLVACDPRRKILLARIERVLLHFGQVAGIDCLLEEVGQALAIGPPFVNHGNTSAFRSSRP